MLADLPLVAFVATSDLDRARGFYGDLLGLDLIEQTPFACLFTAGNTPLRVTLVTAVEPRPYTVLGWAEDLVSPSASPATGIATNAPAAPDAASISTPQSRGHGVQDPASKKATWSPAVHSGFR